MTRLPKAQGFREAFFIMIRRTHSAAQTRPEGNPCRPVPPLKMPGFSSVCRCIEGAWITYKDKPGEEQAYPPGGAIPLEPFAPARALLHTS
jgi:hypothetical protein